MSHIFIFLRYNRYEAKHLFFTTEAKKTKNFRNICKTLAVKHQQSLPPLSMVYVDRTQLPARSKAVQKLSNREVQTLTNSYLGNKMDKLRAISFWKRNGVEYRQELMLLNDTEFFEIITIIQEHTDFYFLCQPFEVSGYDEFCHSLIVSKNVTGEVRLLTYSELINKNVYEKIIYREKMYIIAQSLDLKRFVEKFTH